MAFVEDNPVFGEVVRHGTGKGGVLCVGWPHPDEPVGELACRLLLSWLEQDRLGDLARVPWTFVPCADPRGAAANRAWFAAGDLHSWLTGHQRPSAHEDGDDAHALHGDAAILPRASPPRARAMARLIREAEPALVALLHTHPCSDAYTYVSHRPSRRLLDDLEQITGPLMPRQVGLLEPARVWDGRHLDVLREPDRTEVLLRLDESGPRPHRAWVPVNVAVQASLPGCWVTTPEVGIFSLTDEARTHGPVDLRDLVAQRAAHLSVLSSRGSCETAMAAIRHLERIRARLELLAGRRAEMSAHGAAAARLQLAQVALSCRADDLIPGLLAESGVETVRRSDELLATAHAAQVVVLAAHRFGLGDVPTPWIPPRTP